MVRSFFVYVLVLLAAPSVASAASSRANNMYCGDKECYNVLGVDRSATKKAIARAYRALSLKHHPDKHKHSGQAAANKLFQQIGAAYTVLSNARSRKDYNYYLDHPEDLLHNTAYYYKHTYSPTSDARWVLGGLLLFCTGFQLLIQWQRYQMALKQYRRQPEVQQRAYEIFVARRTQQRTGGGDADGKLQKRIGGSATGGDNADGKLQKRIGGSAKAGASGKAARRQEKIASRQPALSREDVLELEAIVEHEVLPAVHVEGGYHKPGFWDLFPVQLVYAPFALGRCVQWHLSWWFRFCYRREEYDYDAREFLTKKATRMSKTQWAMLPVEQREELMAKALWVPENMDAVREEQRMEFARKHPEQYKRW